MKPYVKPKLRFFGQWIPEPRGLKVHISMDLAVAMAIAMIRQMRREGWDL